MSYERSWKLYLRLDELQREMQKVKDEIARATRPTEGVTSSSRTAGEPVQAKLLDFLRKNPTASRREICEATYGKPTKTNLTRTSAAVSYAKKRELITKKQDGSWEVK